MENEVTVLPHPALFLQLCVCVCVCGAANVLDDLLTDRYTVKVSLETWRRQPDWSLCGSSQS